MTEKPAHLADLVVAAVGIGIALVCLSVSAGPFEGQIISGAAHLALSVVLAAGCARGLHFAVRLQRPRWVWPVVVVSLSFGFHGLVRVINALDRSEPVARRTHVAQWHSKYVSRRGSGKWVRRVVLASWKSPSEQLEFRVPEGAVTRESHFADTRRARLRQAWEARMKEADEKRPSTLLATGLGELAKLNPDRERAPPPYPEPSLEQLLFPESVPCDVLMRPGVLGLEHLVGLRLLNEP